MRLSDGKLGKPAPGVEEPRLRFYFSFINQAVLTATIRKMFKGA